MLLVAPGATKSERTLTRTRLAAVKVHHLNCGSLCPHGRRLLNGDGGWLEKGHIVCHCLAIETGEGLVLVDTGFGIEDARDPRQLGRRLRLDERRTAGRDHGAGATRGRSASAPPTCARSSSPISTPTTPEGCPTSPHAEVHVLSTELDAALSRALKDRLRYLPGPLAARAALGQARPEGDDWFGFESVRILPGLDAEVLLIPLFGHSRGHTGVALRKGDGWLLHCGDAYFNHGEIETPPSCPPGLRVFQMLNGADGKARKRNRDRLQELAAATAKSSRSLCSHDPYELKREQARAAPRRRTG